MSFRDGRVPKGVCVTEKFTILARGSDTHCPGARSRQERALCAPRQRRALSPGRIAEANARRCIRRRPLLPLRGGGNIGRPTLWPRSRPCSSELEAGPGAVVQDKEALFHVTADLTSFRAAWVKREHGQKKYSIPKGWGSVVPRTMGLHRPNIFIIFVRRSG